MATAELEGLEGCEPKTVASFEFVVFKTDELVLVEGYWHVPELGSVLVTTAVPPKLQLVGTGFFW